jgi:GxxExxY protein
MSQATFKHGGLTHKIIGAAFEVHRVLGYGFLEKVYKLAMQVELQHAGLSAELEAPLDVFYKTVNVGHFCADILVEKNVLVEIKVAPDYCEQDEAQLLNELKASALEIGLLINFGIERVAFKRFIFSNQ